MILKIMKIIISSLERKKKDLCIPLVLEVKDDSHSVNTAKRKPLRNIHIYREGTASPVIWPSLPPHLNFELWLTIPGNQDRSTLVPTKHLVKGISP